MKYIVFVCFFLAPALVFAQVGKTTIMGSVVDKTAQQFIEFVTVALLNKKDSIIIKGTITDKKGKFSMEEIPPGDYFIRYSFIGYDEVTTRDFRIAAEQKNINLRPCM